MTGSTVTLQGCVVAAERKDTFVLTNVREWPVATDMGKFGKRYYWIEKTAKMKATLGTPSSVGEIRRREVRDGVQGGEAAASTWRSRVRPRRRPVPPGPTPPPTTKPRQPDGVPNEVKRRRRHPHRGADVP